MAEPQDIARAARHAAARVELLLAEMLAKGEWGEVGIEVTPAGLQPYVRAERRYKLVKLAQGNGSVVETVKEP